MLGRSSATASTATSSAAVGKGKPIEFGKYAFENPQNTKADKFTCTEQVLKVSPRMFVLGKYDEGAITSPAWRSLMLSNRSRDELFGATEAHLEVEGVLDPVGIEVWVQLDDVLGAKAPLGPEREHRCRLDSSAVEARVAAEHPRRDVGEVGRRHQIRTPEVLLAELLVQGIGDVESSKELGEQDAGRLEGLCAIALDAKVTTVGPQVGHVVTGGDVRLQLGDVLAGDGSGHPVLTLGGAGDG